MNVVTNEDAIELAYSFAIYKAGRVVDLDTEMDCQLAESAARRLRRTQEEVGIFLVETQKLEATERRMQRYANILRAEGSI